MQKRSNNAATLGEIYQRRGTKPVISFEVFPPKTDAAYAQLQDVLPELVSLRPDYMTVTYGAMGTTRDRTLEIAASIQQKYSIPTACHLTCVGSSRDELQGILRAIYESGIRNLVALRGDPPQGQTTFTPPPDGFGHANELVAHIRSEEKKGFLGRCGIAVAGYPEKHLEAPDLETDLRNLKRKVDSGADCVITQLFYDNDRFKEFAKKALALGIEVPMIPGLLPILSAKQVMRITSICGACLLEPLKEDLNAAGDDAAAAERIGIRQCIAQARDLLQSGAPGIHFYVLNKSSHMTEIMRGIADLR
jgi:methylenetetrahydrofolate reductase (NADPH)